MSEAPQAVEALDRLGLTEYEARCFVALTQLPHGQGDRPGGGRPPVADLRDD